MICSYGRACCADHNGDTLNGVAFSFSKKFNVIRYSLTSNLKIKEVTNDIAIEQKCKCDPMVGFFTAECCSVSTIHFHYCKNDKMLKYAFRSKWVWHCPNNSRHQKVYVQGFLMMYLLFLYYHWFFQNIEKGWIIFCHFDELEF